MRTHLDVGATDVSPGFTIYNDDGSVYAARSTTGVTEEPAGSGSFGVTIADSVLAGRAVVWTLTAGGIGASEAFPAAAPTAGAIADAVLDAALTDHETAGTIAAAIASNICKWVENGDGTAITLYKANGTDPLGTFSWTEATRTRGRLA